MDYNKLLEKARKVYAESVTGAEKRRLESIFPELKMSEDKRIRKEIIEFLQLSHRQFVGNRKQEKWIVWLEKQGEQQPYRGNADTMRKNLIKAFKSVGSKHWGGFDVRDIIHFLESKDAIELEKQGEQKPVDSYCKENCKGYQETGKCFADGECKAKKDAEQKPAWSDEDEKIIDDLTQTISQYTVFAHREPKEIIHWLKSLKPQPQWKPTEEQMEALDKVYKTHGADCECRHIILGLLNDLKKL